MVDGVVTQTRLTPGLEATAELWTSSFSQVGKESLYERQRYSRLYSSTQTTTSFRTGQRGRFGDTSSSLEEIVDSSDSSYSAMFNALKKDSDHTPRSGDRGHEFDTTVQRYVLSHGDTNLYGVGNPGQYWRYKGPVYINPQYTSAGYDLTIPAVDTAYYGVKAINLALPTHPVAGLAVGLAELAREGIPSRPGSSGLQGRALQARDAGDEYLNAQFGWLPLVGDLQSAAYAVKNANKLLDQYRRDSGRSIRRRYYFPPEVSTSESTSSGSLNIAAGTPTQEAYFLGSTVGSPMKITTQKYKRVWFSGAFTYHLSDGGDGRLDRLRELEQKANLLLGTDLTPEVLWNLAPWSWLTDWFVNIGDQISNATRLMSDGLVMRYGYLMCEQITDKTYTLFPQSSQAARLGPVHVTFTTIRKQRVRATPFGFARNPASFTPRQWAILGALGLTKAPNQLW